MEALGELLDTRDIEFDVVEWRIRCISSHNLMIAWSYTPWRCFPHIVNLACKAVLSAITHIKYAAENADDYVPPMTRSATFTEAIAWDPIAILRSLIRGVCLKMHWLNNTDLIYRFEHHLFDDNTFLMSSLHFAWRICSFSMMLIRDGHQLSSWWKGHFYSVLWATSLTYLFYILLT